MNTDPSSEQIAGFNASFEPSDDYMAGQYERYGLGNHPSLEMIEPVAKPILGTPNTSLQGAQLVLNRRIYSDTSKEDPNVLEIVVSDADPGEKFGALLLQRFIEKRLLPRN